VLCVGNSKLIQSTPGFAALVRSACDCEEGRRAAGGLPVGGAMLYAQVDEFPSSPHVEWPGRKAENEWLRAFDWIRRNIHVQAYSVVNPRYLERPGEDFHVFRAFTERSVLAGQINDASVAGISPVLADEWWLETEAQRNGTNFGSDDLRGLNARFGVDWVLLERNDCPQPEGLQCPYESGRIRICRIE
jgi:hypothetical protein